MPGAFKKKKELLINKYGERCLYCGVDFSKSELTLDHVIPKAKGGSNKLNNLVLACLPCNQKKDKKLYSYYHINYLKQKAEELNQINEGANNER